MPDRTAPAVTLVAANWGFKDPEAVTRDVLWMLTHGYDMRVVGHLGRDGVLVEPAFDLTQLRQPPIYAISDNGGEIQVWVVNGPDGGRGIPVTAFGVPLDAGTIAYRVASAIKGQAIDWDARYPDLVTELREALAEVAA